MKFCSYCGEQMLDNAQFCQNCGKGATCVVSGVSNSEFAAQNSNQKKINNILLWAGDNRILMGIAVGFVIILFMYLVGESITYPTKYSHESIVGNIGAFLSYGFLFGFAVRAVPSISRSCLKYTIGQAIGSALLCLTLTSLGYFFYVAAIESRVSSMIVLFSIIALLLFVISIPLAKSIDWSVNFNGIKFNGIYELKKNLLIGTISVALGWGLIYLMMYLMVYLSFNLRMIWMAKFISNSNFSIYVLLGILGFINYMALLKFGKTTPHMT